MFLFRTDVHSPPKPLTVLTIDGPSASGKSTVASMLGQRFGGRVLYTGKQYRAATAALLRAGVSFDHERITARALVALSPRLDEDGVLSVGGRSISDAEAESPEVESMVSTVAVNDEIRELLRGLQRDFIRQNASAERPIVVEGRDAGTSLAPDAAARFFLDCSVDERALRRGRQRGLSDAQRLQVAESLSSRDRQDQGHGRATRDTEGLIYILTDGMSADAVVEAIWLRIERRPS
jgi:cytidylate kinase